MSGKLCSIITPAEVALVAATPKTILQLKTTSGTNLPRALVKRVGIFFDGTSTVAEPAVIKFIRQTTDGTGTTVTPAMVGDSTDAILATGAYNFSAEPTSGDIIDIMEIHPQSGYAETFPLGMEIVVKAGTRLGIVVTAPAAVNCVARIWFDE